MITDDFSLDRAERIRKHEIYLREYERLQRMEQGRKFCGHSMEHFLDVARACWILALERNLAIRKDVVYAAGLLHDIGKGMQYEFEMPHHTAGADLAERVLPDCGYTPEETAMIAQAIRQHRELTETDSPLSAILYEADKKTRLCFACPSTAECNWPEAKKTQKLYI